MRESVALADPEGNLLRSSEAVLPLYSLTKPYIAACIFTAGVDVETRISRWFPASLVPRGEEIRVRHLLNHTSGLRDYGALEEYQAAIQTDEVWTDNQFADVTLRRELLFAPGTQWSYSNPGYWLLAQIVQRACDRELRDCVEKFVVCPLGLQHTAVVNGEFAKDLPGYPAGWVWHGLIQSTAAEVIRFMRSSLVQPLMAAGGQITVPVEHPAWRNPRWGYGLMFDDQRHYGHNGDGPGYSAACFRSLTSGFTACVLCTAQHGGEATERALDMLGR